MSYTNGSVYKLKKKYNNIRVIKYLCLLCIIIPHFHWTYVPIVIGVLNHDSVIYGNTIDSVTVGRVPRTRLV